jgi:hypothetical protein
VVWFRNGNCYLPYSTGTSSQSWYTYSSYGNFPSTYNTNSAENYVYSLYATVSTLSSNPNTTPTPSVIPTTIPTPVPTSAPPVSPPLSNAKGELYLWIGYWMTPGDSNTQKIVSAHDSYQVPIWVEAGNWGAAHLTSSLINYFHAHGVKVVCRLWSDGGNNPLNTILHDSNPNNGKGGSVDYQMRIGPEIDAFMIDETLQSNPSYYTAISNYVHSLGKPMFVNTGTFDVLSQTLTYADKVSTEFCWYQFITNPAYHSLIVSNPQKFIGISNDWGYANQPYAAPKSASGDRPVFSAPMSEQRAVWDVKTGWAGGVYCMAAQPSDVGALPSWWSQFVSDLR